LVCGAAEAAVRSVPWFTFPDTRGGGRDDRGARARFAVVGARRAARGARHEISRRLGAHLIDDIGLGPEEAAEEAGKPFWRA
jgi:uncharacterized protein YjiS (DUF1127 family)